MNKTELIAAAAQSAGMQKKDAERLINAAIDTITATLAKGEKVQLSGFGIFEVKDREAVWAATPIPRKPSAFRPPGCSSPAKI